MSVSINEELFTGGVASDDLSALLAAVDGLEGSVDGIEALLTAIDGHVDGIEALLSAISGQVYTEGDVDTSITGPAMLAEETETSTLRTVQTRQLSVQVEGTDYGVITNSVIHGKTTAGGGAFVDVKVTPSGALSVAATQDTSPWVVSEIKSATPTTSSVAASVTNVTLLTSNTSRKGATFYNDSATATLYLKHGATATTSSFTVKMFPNDYYEVPFGYTGIIDGIWDIASGACRVTEQT